jgi:hypothetical protein
MTIFFYFSWFNGIFSTVHFLKAAVYCTPEGIQCITEYEAFLPSYDLAPHSLPLLSVFLCVALPAELTDRGVGGSGIQFEANISKYEAKIYSLRSEKVLFACFISKRIGEFYMRKEKKLKQIFLSNRIVRHEACERLS